MSSPPGARIPVAFARLLEGMGVEVPLGSVVSYARALSSIDLAERDDVYWAGRATLLSRVNDVAIYDRAFAAFWERRSVEALEERDRIDVSVGLDEEDGGDEDPTEEGDSPGDQAPVLAVRYSPVEILRNKDFAECNEEELAEAQALMERIGTKPPFRRSRRMRAAKHSGRRPDIRRTVRRSLRSHGEPITREWLEAGSRPRRVVLLLDVSGSMEAYSRALLRFAHVAVASGMKVEAFTIGTRLTRVTRELTERDPDAAISKASEAVGDWSGGTRLGETLSEFNSAWGVRGMARGAVVVICSDGWDRGDPEVLGSEMARLARVAYRIVWVNPLKATPGYAPLARGMAAALPSVDEFVEGHSLASLESLSEVIGR